MSIQFLDPTFSVYGNGVIIAIGRGLIGLMSPSEALERFRWVRVKEMLWPISPRSSRTVRTRCLSQCRGDYISSRPYLPSLCSRRRTSLINAVVLVSRYFE